MYAALGVATPSGDLHPAAAATYVRCDICTGFYCSWCRLGCDCNGQDLSDEEYLSDDGVEVDGDELGTAAAYGPWRWSACCGAIQLQAGVHPLTAAVYEPCGFCDDTRCSWCLGGCACDAPLAHYAWEVPDDVEDESDSESELDDDVDTDDDDDAGGGDGVTWQQIRRQLRLRGGGPKGRGEAGSSADSGPVEQAVDEGELAGLLDELNAAVDSDAPEMERGRLANAIAQRLAVRRPLAATRKAIIAASQWVRMPARYESAEACRAFFGAGRSSTIEWRTRITDALVIEAAAAELDMQAPAEAPVPTSPQATSGGSSDGSDGSTRSESRRERSRRRAAEIMADMASVRAAIAAAPAAAPPHATDTSMGAHNLNMNGNEPIAHGGGLDAVGLSPTPMLGGDGAHSATPTGNVNERRCVAPPAASLDSPVDMCVAAQAGRSPGGGCARAALDAWSPAIQQLATARGSPRPRSSTAVIDDAIDIFGADDLGPGGARAGRPASPQPQTAQQARAATAHYTANLLAADVGPYALCADRPELLKGLVVEACEARDAGIPHGTASADEWGFAWVRRFGLATGCAWMRPREARTAAEVTREIYFTIMALVWIAHMMAPSLRRRRQGYGQGLPTSSLLAIYAFRRVMRDCGRYLPDMTEVRRVLKGICARYKARWGDEAFVPQRKQPFSTAQLLGIVAVLAQGVACWPAVLCKAVLTAFCHAIATGARKDEWTASFAGDTYVRRANFHWVDDNERDLPDTPETISSRKNGDMLRGRSAPSKCDRLNIEWGGRDMWFRYDDSNPLNFAWRWQQWEIAYPCPPQERRAWPAFSPSGDDVPFTGTRADGCLMTVLLLVMSAAEAAMRSWHSCRVTIAKNLMHMRGTRIARDEVEGVIQSVVRWKTPEAMRIYARMDAKQYADYVDMATSPHIAEVTGDEPLPEIDPEGVIADHDATLAALDAEATRAAQAAKALKAAAAQPPQGKARRPRPSTGEPTKAGKHARAAAPRAFDIGNGEVVHSTGGDSWGIDGERLHMHHSFWGGADDGSSPCVVQAYIGAYKFMSGAASAHTFVIECEGHYYPARHTAVANAIADPAVRRRVRRTRLKHWE